MKPISVVLLLLSCGAGVAQARDPFRPLPGAACLAEVEPLSEWRLQGIIGRAPRFQGWLLTPQGKSVHVLSDQPFPLFPGKPSGLLPVRFSYLFWAVARPNVSRFISKDACMIRIAILTLLLFCQIPAHASPDEGLSLAFDDAPIERILQALADYQQINLMISLRLTERCHCGWTTSPGNRRCRWSRGWRN